MGSPAINYMPRPPQRRQQFADPRYAAAMRQQLPQAPGAYGVAPNMAAPQPQMQPAQPGVNPLSGAAGGHAFWQAITDAYRMNPNANPATTYQNYWDQQQAGQPTTTPPDARAETMKPKLINGPQDAATEDYQLRTGPSGLPDSMAPSTRVAADTSGEFGPVGPQQPQSQLPQPQQQGPPVAGPRQNVVPPYNNSRDPYDMSQYDRTWAYGQGAMINQDVQDRTDNQDYWEQYFRNQGMNAYGDIAAGQGGYRPGEQTDIMGREGLDQLQQTDAERQSNYLTDDEQSQMAGNPEAYRNWFDPEWTSQIQDRQNTDQREGLIDTTGRMRGAIDPTKLQANTAFVNPTIEAGAANVRNAIPAERLRQSQDAAGRIRMSPNDVQDIITAQGTSVGNLTRSRQEEIGRRSAAAGMNAPLSIAAATNRLQMEGDAQSADAMLNARIGARREAADREMALEMNRQNAERGLAGLQSSAEMALGARSLAGQQWAEGQRRGSEQDISDRQIGVEGTVGGMRQAVARQTGQDTQAMARWNAQMGTDIERDIDQTRAGRAAAIATNRQGAEQYNQGQRYGRGMDRNTAISQRTQAVAAPRLSQEAEYRNWLAQQQGQASGNVERGQDRRVNLYGTTGRLGQGATGQTMDYDLARRNQSFGTNFKRSAGQNLGRTVTSPSTWMGTGGGG